MNHSVRQAGAASLSFTAAMTLYLFPIAASAAPPLPGAIFTTSSTCTATNLNIYGSKSDVFLNGGPDRPGAAGLLPNASFYVQVTNPSGSILLGTSVGTGNPTPVHTNALGNFTACLQLQSIVSPVPYLDSPNPGNEYKVWVSTVDSFSNDSTKTDNFKVLGTPVVPENGSVVIRKFYDANVNGKWDTGEPELPLIAATGWKVDMLGYDPQLTAALYPNLLVGAGTDYVTREFMPVQKNWYPTVAYSNPSSPAYPTGSTPPILNQFTVTLTPANKDQTVVYGNVCTGAGGGLTIGFWSNKNGKALFDANGGLGVVQALPLANATGAFSPASYAQFQAWLLNANAVNMGYMLSAQLSAMALNVASHKVDGAALIYAPGVPGAILGFAPVSTVMKAGIDSLTAHRVTLAGSPFRSEQEMIKNALDKANNNLTFAQAAPCAYSFD